MMWDAPKPPAISHQSFMSIVEPPKHKASFVPEGAFHRLKGNWGIGQYHELTQNDLKFYRKI